MPSIAELLSLLNDSLKYEEIKITGTVAKKKEKTVKEKEIETKSNTAKIGTKGHTLLKVASAVSNTIENDSNWRYKVNSPNSSFNWARNNTRFSNCATFACWCLQRMGALKSGQHFYSSKYGNVRCSDSVKTELKKHAKIISVGKACYKADLQPGDVCCWAGHTNIYVGKNAKGKRLWYDAGYSATWNKTPGSRFKDIGPRYRSSLDSRKLYHIVRVK